MFEFVVCGPGMYFGDIPIPTSFHLSQCVFGMRKCVQCPENTTKTVWGNELALCVDDAGACDGRTSVPSSDQSGCGKCS